MNPFKFAAAVCLLIGSVIPLVSSVVVPGASTPLFYLVSSSSSDPANLLPLRLTGSAEGYTTLTGSGAIGQFYFFQGKFVALDSTESSTEEGYIAALLLSSCSTYGPLGFGATTGTDKCGTRGTFGLQSDSENSQLGAALTFNSVGGFYACGSGQDVWYKVNAGDGPTGCSPISLYTVPVS